MRDFLLLPVANAESMNLFLVHDIYESEIPPYTDSICWLLIFISPQSGINKCEEFLDKVLLVANKVDLELDTGSNATATSSTEEIPLVWRNLFDSCISCKTLDGLETFTELLATKVAEM